MSIRWEPEAYTVLPMDLGLGGQLRWSADPPAGWTTGRAYQAHEETLQTVLSLHLAEVCAEPVQLVGLAGDYWGGADIIGLDALGRVHLLELKRATVGEDAARQLSYYTLRQVFVDAAQYIQDRWERMGDWELQDWRLAQTLAGALAGRQTNNLGYAFIGEHDRVTTLSEATWGKLTAEQKQPLKLAALLKKAETRLDGVPTPETLLELARAWRSRLRAQEAPPTGSFLCQRPVVIWLVGPSFKAEAEQELQRWRAAGVDARCLKAEVRLSSQRVGLILRVARESAPGRAELVQHLAGWAAEHEFLGPRARLELHLYTAAKASDRLEKWARAGLPLPKEQLRATIKLPAGRSIELRVPEETVGL